MQPYEESDDYRSASHRVAHVDAGPRHSIAVTTDGFYYSWASGREYYMELFLLEQVIFTDFFPDVLASAQLGLGSKELAEVPTLLTNKVTEASLHLCSRISDWMVLIFP